VVSSRPAPSAEIERYRLHDEIASGGMGTVHIGRLVAPGGFARTVAIKRLHRHLTGDPDIVAMFLDEARLAARVRHPNVVPTLDVVAANGEFLLVMEYVHGIPLSEVLARLGSTNERMPLDVVAAVMSGLLQGLHAAHEATDEAGQPLAIVHRDVSPQNVLVGVDGGVRVLDFGIAKAAHRLHTTQDGAVRGKLRYMAPEQFRGERVDRRSDVFSAGVLLWELLTARRLFESDVEAAGAAQSSSRISAPSAIVEGVPAAFDAVALRALARDPADRFDTALAMALAIEGAIDKLGGATRVAAWVADVCGDRVRGLAERINVVESGESLGPITADVAVPPEADRTRIRTVVLASRPAPRAKPRIASYALLVVAALAVLATVIGIFVVRGGEKTAGAAPPPAPVAPPTMVPAAETASPIDPPAVPPPVRPLPRVTHAAAPAVKRATPAPSPSASSSSKHLYERPW
jgi:eukaryotic-like serine/threonine-protein kinase